MRQLILNIPDELSLESKDVLKFLSAKLYEAGKLSLGQAAEMAGHTKVTFTAMLSDYNVSFINYNFSDVKRDASKL